MLKDMTEERRALVVWLHAASSNPMMAVFILGALTARGLIHPDVKLWDAVAEVKTQLRGEALEHNED